MRIVRLAGATTLASAMAYAGSPAALGAEATVTREDRIVANEGVFTACADGTQILLSSVSDRHYTTWWREGVAVREHRHLDFVGTLTDGAVSFVYSGVWNRDEDLTTGEVRITGGNFRIDLPGGRTLVGAGFRAEGSEFKGSGDRFLTHLCVAFRAE